MKILNNTLAMSNLALIFEALKAAQSLDIDPDAVLEALHHTSGGSVMVDFVPFYRPMPRMDYVALLDKDVALFESLYTSNAGSLIATTARRMVDQLKCGGSSPQE